MNKNKSVLDLSLEEKTQFFTLHNTFKSAEKQEERVKALWAFLCFVYKHLGNDLLVYFTKQYFNENMTETIAMMVRARAFVQPHLFEKD